MRWLWIAVIGVQLSLLALAQGPAPAPAPAPAPVSALGPTPPAAPPPIAFLPPAPRSPAAAVARQPAGRTNFLASPLLFHISEGALVTAASFDLVETAVGMSSRHVLQWTPTGASTAKVDVDFSQSFAEGGWAKFVGRHDTGGVLAMNAASDLLVDSFARHLAREGPVHRILGSALLIAWTVGHIQGGRSWIGLHRRLAAPYAGFHPVWLYYIAALPRSRAPTFHQLCSVVDSFGTPVSLSSGMYSKRGYSCLLAPLLLFARSRWRLLPLPLPIWTTMPDASSAPIKSFRK